MAPDNSKEFSLTDIFGIFIFSAGGLATYLHADYIRSKIPSSIPVHAIADAGYVLLCV